MDFKMDIPSHILEIIRIIEDSNYEVYLVGGCVRDSFLNIKINDYDLASNASVNQLKEVFKDYKIINNNGEKHSTITVRFNHENIEITSFKRNDDEDNSIEVDLSHRDITMNAMAYNPRKGLIDPYNGVDSIKNKTIKTLLDPIARFKEDPLRILRVLRFASKYSFKINNEDIKAMYLLKDLLKDIAKERIASEINGILVGNSAFDIILNYKEIVGVVIPELIPTFDFDQKTKYHLHDVYTHTCYVVKNTMPDLVTRLAALFHDIGKPDAYFEEIKDGLVIGHFYGHPKDSKRITQKILRRLKYSNEIIEDVLFLIEYHDYTIGYNKKSVSKLLSKIPNDMINNYYRLLDLKNADHLDHQCVPEIDFILLKEIANDIIKTNSCLKIKDLKVNGNDLMSLGFVGKEIGDTLKELLEKVLDEKLNNNYDELIEYIKKTKN